MFGLGRQGMAQSNQCAFHACVICGAPIRISYFVVAYLGFQIFQALTDRNPYKGISWQVAQACSDFVLLYLTVLVHEFGHGTMARCIGGEIDHILLWPFGGICFSTRPPERDPRKLVKNDLKVVAAGPATHFPQVLVWIIFGMLLVLLVNLLAPRQLVTCSGMDCYYQAVNPFQPSFYLFIESDFVSLLLSIPSRAILLNIALFLFNVFFPMYPADGAKLLSSSLMHCCHVRPYNAALVLIICTITCAVLLISWSAYNMLGSYVGAATSGGPPSSFTTANRSLTGMLPLFLGLMSLQEAYTLFTLRSQQRLSEHPCFAAARTEVIRTRDEHGMVATLNNTGRDDPFQPFGGTSGRPLHESPRECCLKRCLCGWRRSPESLPSRPPRPSYLGEREDPDLPPTPHVIAGPADPVVSQQMRQDRSQFLARLQQEQPQPRQQPATGP